MLLPANLTEHQGEDKPRMARREGTVVYLRPRCNR